MWEDRDGTWDFVTVSLPGESLFPLVAVDRELMDQAGVIAHSASRAAGNPVRLAHFVEAP